MKEYLGALMATALLGGVIKMLSPEGDLQKYLRWSVALCLVAAMVQIPIGWLSEGGEFSFEDFFSEDLPTTQDYDEIYNQSLQSGAKDQAKEIIISKIYQAFSLSEESASVEVLFLSENEILSLQEIRVSLHGKGVLTDPREIVSFVEETFGCPCTVLYE